MKQNPARCSSCRYGTHLVSFKAELQFLTSRSITTTPVALTAITAVTPYGGWRCLLKPFLRSFAMKPNREIDGDQPYTISAVVFGVTMYDRVALADAS